MSLMTGTKVQNYAVVMGDLVQSERSSALEQLHIQFNQSVDHQNATHIAKLASPLTITLGDEFQGLTKSLADAIPIIRDMRFQLMNHKIDCRFVIGSVELKTKLNPDKAWNMMGPGLSRAREKLDEKRPVSLYRFSIPQNLVIEKMLDALGAGLTVIERSWTEQQRKDIASLISGLTPTELAKRRNVSVHSIYKVRGSGDFDAYVIQWQAISEALASLDKQLGQN